MRLKMKYDSCTVRNQTRFLEETIPHYEEIVLDMKTVGRLFGVSGNYISAHCRKWDGFPVKHCGNKCCIRPKALREWLHESPSGIAWRRKREKKGLWQEPDWEAYGC